MEGPARVLPKSWLAACEAAASQEAEKRGAIASVALDQVSMGYSANLHSASSASNSGAS